jgi:hypothetical protein
MSIEWKRAEGYRKKVCVAIAGFEWDCLAARGIKRTVQSFNESNQSLFGRRNQCDYNASHEITFNNGREKKRGPENKRMKKTKGKQGERTYLTLKARVWLT